MRSVAPWRYTTLSQKSNNCIGGVSLQTRRQCCTSHKKRVREPTEKTREKICLHCLAKIPAQSEQEGKQPYVAVLAQAISCSNVHGVFPVHERFWFSFVQVSTTQFCCFPLVLTARASDGTDVPVSPLPASSSNLGSPHGSLPDIEGNQRNVRTSCKIASTHTERIQVRKLRPDAFPDSGLV